MALRNGVDIVESTTEVRPRPDGAFDVVSVVTTMEYSGCSKYFAEFLATKLQDEGVTYPVKRGDDPGLFMSEPQSPYEDCPTCLRKELPEYIVNDTCRVCREGR